MYTYQEKLSQTLVVIITEGDIKALVQTLRRKIRRNTTISAELKKYLGANSSSDIGKYRASLYQLWRIILLGPYNPETLPGNVFPFISMNTVVHWLHIIFNTLDEHFSGEIAKLGKNNAINYIFMFNYDADDEQKVIVKYQQEL